MISTRLKKWLRALPLLGACHPILAPTPMQLGETAPALQEREVSITGQGGAVSAGSGLGTDGTGGGGGLRLRYGLPGNQEIGVEGLIGYVSATGNTWSGNVYGGKLSYKIAPDPHLALVAGAGFGSGPTGNSAGADLALIISTAGTVRPYLGVRGALGARLGSSGDGTAAFIVPAGLSVGGSRFRLFIEAGLGAVETGSQSETLVYGSGGISIVTGP